MIRPPHFHFITLFPEVIQLWLTTSILGRAFQAKIFDFTVYPLRDYATDKHRTVDDFAYGGGGGMVLKVEPLVAALEKIFLETPRATTKVIYLSPVGKPLNQSLLTELEPGETLTDLVLVCGHYEGVDQRFVDHWVDMEISLGDFVLTGGEIPALALADALIRRIKGTLSSEEAVRSESFSLPHPRLSNALLEYPHYTRPAEFRGLRVPDVLLAGHHEKVETWRMEQAEEKTRRVRPEMLPSRQ